MSPQNKKIPVPSTVLQGFSTGCPSRQKISGLTVLIPIRGSDRNKNLSIIVPYLLAQNIEPLEILIVEEDIAPTIKLGTLSRNSNVHLVFLKSNEPFNKSRVMNAGTAHARYNKICMIDVDMIIEKGFLFKISSLLDTYDVCFTIKDIYFLTEMPLFSNYFHDGKNWKKNVKFDCHGGIVAYNRIAFTRIGGMNEEFIGHGSEDTEFYERAKETLKYYDTRFATVLHIPHPRDLECATKNEQKYRKLKREPIKETIARLKHNFEKNWGTIKPIKSHQPRSD